MIKSSSKRRSVVVSISSRPKSENTADINVNTDFDERDKSKDDLIPGNIEFIHAPAHRSKTLREIFSNDDVADLRVLKSSKNLPEQLASSAADSVSQNILINVRKGEHDLPIYLPDVFVNVLKEHQVQGVRFLWRNVVQDGAGAVLAHAMGLGKTIQVISFLYTLFSTSCPSLSGFPSRLSKQRQMTVLILCPPIVIDNWESEFEKWIPSQLLHKHVQEVYKLKKANGLEKKHSLLKKWQFTGGIMLCGYQMFRDLVYLETGDPQKPKNKAEESIAFSRKLLCDPGPDCVVCDEGHVIKNDKSSLNSAVSLISTPHKICLTGYPLQNNLKEYWCMINFSRPTYLPDWEHFRKRFVHWIVNGLYKDASDSNRAYAKQKLYILTIWLEPIVYRMDARILLQTIPPKREYTIQCRLMPLQRKLYERFLKITGSGLSGLFARTTVLTRIVNHPGTLKIARDAQKDPDLDENSLKEMLRVRPEEERMYTSFDWAEPEINDPILSDLGNSGKMMVALNLIDLARKSGEKTLLFSRSICTLDYISGALESQNIKFYRIDGSVHSSKRQSMIESFRPDDSAEVFLLSSLAGSLGVNLTAASRVILFDIGWNPCHDEQAIGRSFRFGQTRPVYVYRLCAYGTMEVRLYNLNMFKVSLSVQAVDKKDIENLIKKGDLRDYFKPPIDPPASESESLILPDHHDELLHQFAKSASSQFAVQIINHQKALEDFSMLDLPQEQKAEAMKELDMVKRRQDCLRAGKPVPVELQESLLYQDSAYSSVAPSIKRAETFSKDDVFIAFDESDYGNTSDEDSFDFMKQSQDPISSMFKNHSSQSSSQPIGSKLNPIILE